ncbi:MAG TPA: EcsC family protein [Stellaceae bacterium]|nr:EcsC family protein [Stellaceae bacterium]
MNVEPLPPLPPTAHRELLLAIEQLDRENFVTRLAHATGTPVDIAIKYLPGPVNRRLREMVKTAILRCLDVAINSLEEDTDLGAPPSWMGKVLTGISGGIGGFFGMVALPFELPLTTALMLRSIAEIARAEGENLAMLEARLACLEVFAIGGGNETGELKLEYYAVRSVLSRLTQDLSRHMMERGAFNASSPVISRFIGEIASRFGFAVSARFASGIVPVIGAIGGATVNVIFTDHFQRVARSHFIVRRLEREHGSALVRGHYAAALAAASGAYRLGLEAAD